MVFLWLISNIFGKKVGPNLSIGAHPSLVRPAMSNTGAPSMAARHAKHGAVPVPAMSHGSWNSYGLCYWLMH